MSKAMMTHEALKKQALKDPGVRREYDALEEEFALLRELLKARAQANKTQADVAKVMKTSTSVVGRLEVGGGKHSPTVDTLRRYAQAVDCELKIKLIPKNFKSQAVRERAGQ